MKQCIDVYTGTHADNINKKVPGSAFGVVLVGKVNKQTRSTYDENLTYMHLWFKSMDQIVKNIANGNLGYDSVTLFIHTWTPNINRMCWKMQSIFDELKDYDEAAWDVLEIKLRRKNRQRYEYHAEMKSIMLHLLQLNKAVPLLLKFCVTSPKKAREMSVAHQMAETEIVTA